MPKKKAVKPPKPPALPPPTPAIPSPEYWWFKGNSVETLRNRLNVAGATPRLEVRIDKDLKMTLRVRPSPETVTTLDDEPPINESFICPPICP